MVKIKKLAGPMDRFLGIDIPVTSDELLQRKTDYENLTPKRMTFVRNEQAYKHIAFHWNGERYEFQYNYCGNPYCKNYGMPQEKFEKLKNKPSRYRIINPEPKKTVVCNEIETGTVEIPTLGCHTSTVSNWSVAEEIERLVRINSVVPEEPKYEFHKIDCDLTSTPFDTPKDFYRRGISSANSKRYQCKRCKKFTNVLPDKNRNTTYNQKRNDIMPQFAKLLINRVPVSRTCEILGIGRNTYYNKLEWLYRCCLEFLETRETKTLKEAAFNEVWLNTDKMNYVLNNVRKKGEGKKKFLLTSERQLPTQIVVTSDLYTRYVFRADVAFDFDITFDDIKRDTFLYKEDHLNTFLRKNGRFGKHSTYPMKPTEYDSQTMADYRKEVEEMNIRKQYIDGLHVTSTYTAFAQIWLIKNQLQAKKWRIITDEDASLITAYNRVFTEEVKRKDAYYFICKTDKTISREGAYNEYTEAIKELKDWAKFQGLQYDNLEEVAGWYLAEQLKRHSFHNTHHTELGEIYRSYARNPLEHPLATKDRGKRIIDVLTDISHLSVDHLALLLLKVNDNSVNAFLQTIRRRLSVLERPLTTARGDGKSYIYSNFNPKYAQMAITILRTYYNFCLPFKTPGNISTPAQRLGIAKRLYTWEDIIYKR